LDERGIVDPWGDDTIETGKLIAEIGQHGGIHRGLPGWRLVGSQRGDVRDAAVWALDDDRRTMRSGYRRRAKDGVLAVEDRF
jgi:hypothetical protein